MKQIQEQWVRYWARKLHRSDVGSKTCNLNPEAHLFRCPLILSCAFLMAGCSPAPRQVRPSGKLPLEDQRSQCSKYAQTSRSNGALEGGAPAISRSWSEVTPQAKLRLTNLSIGQGYEYRFSAKSKFFRLLVKFSRADYFAFNPGGTGAFLKVSAGEEVKSYRLEREEHTHGRFGSLKDQIFLELLDFESEVNRLVIEVTGAKDDIEVSLIQEIAEPNMFEKTEYSNLPQGYRGLPNGVNFVPRSQWNTTGLRPKGQPSTTPWKRIIVHHTADGNRVDGPSCDRLVRGYLSYHQNELGWTDLGYHFLVCPDGRVFEGRGGGKNTQGAHSVGSNEETVSVAFIGNYSAGAMQPTPASIDAAAKLVNWLQSEVSTLDWDNPLPVSGYKPGVKVPFLTDHNFVLQNNIQFPSSTECAGSSLVQGYIANGRLLQMAKSSGQSVVKKSPQINLCQN